MDARTTSSKDRDQLHQLGYAQELRRGMRTFSNFAVSFTIISILSGCLTLFGFAMNIGGPAIMTLGWLVVGFFVTLVALGMAEVASSYPTAGGLYYWAAKLAPGVRPRPGQVELVRRLVQPRRPGRRHRRHRLRAGAFATALLNLTFGYPVDADRARSPSTRWSWSCTRC